ncbi:hypothetical protein PP707_05380 [Acetobacter pasteurianus]|nr:hypothetical protein [Acetobacter pasteurianus]
MAAVIVVVMLIIINKINKKKGGCCSFNYLCNVDILFIIILSPPCLSTPPLNQNMWKTQGPSQVVEDSQDECKIKNRTKQNKTNHETVRQ